MKRSNKVTDRVAAIEMLGHLPFKQTESAYQKLLTSTEPAEIQIACINALQLNGRDKIASVLLSQWSSISPTAKNAAMTLMLRRTTSSRELLEAMQNKKVNKAIVSIDMRVRLLKSRDQRTSSHCQKSVRWWDLCESTRCGKEVQTSSDLERELRFRAGSL